MISKNNKLKVAMANSENKLRCQLIDIQKMKNDFEAAQIDS